VCPCGAGGDPEGPPHLVVRAPGCDQRHDFSLTVGQRRVRDGGRPRHAAILPSLVRGIHSSVGVTLGVTARLRAKLRAGWRHEGAAVRDRGAHRHSDGRRPVARRRARLGGRGVGCRCGGRADPADRRHGAQPLARRRRRRCDRARRDRRGAHPRRTAGRSDRRVDDVRWCGARGVGGRSGATGASPPRRARTAYRAPLWRGRSRGGVGRATRARRPRRRSGRGDRPCGRDRRGLDCRCRPVGAHGRAPAGDDSRGGRGAVRDVERREPLRRPRVWRGRRAGIPCVGWR